MSAMGRRRRRRLDAEERRLWERVAATANPLRSSAAIEPLSTTVTPPAAAPERPGETAAAPRPLATAAAAPAPKATPTLRPQATFSAPKARVTWSGPDAAPVGRPEAGLDRRTAERLRKGEREPDARIDLHGMTAERAHDACLRFLAGAAARGHRVVLVITGKGRRDAHGHLSGRGVLRDSLPGWLRASPLGHSIVKIFQAHRRHGGEGAFYVYLKRQR